MLCEIDVSFFFFNWGNKVKCGMLQSCGQE